MGGATDLLAHQLPSQVNWCILFSFKQGLGGMGSASVMPLGKRALMFDHVLSRLQGELQKSQEMGVEYITSLGL
jgi:hypothetical protein